MGFSLILLGLFDDVVIHQDIAIGLTQTDAVFGDVMVFVESTSDFELFDALEVSGVAVASVVDEGFSWGGLAKDVVKGFVDAVAASEVVLAAIKDISAFAVILLRIIGSEEVAWGSDGSGLFFVGWDGNLFVAKELDGGFWKSTFGVWGSSNSRKP